MKLVIILRTLDIRWMLYLAKVDRSFDIGTDPSHKGSMHKRLLLFVPLH